MRGSILALLIALAMAFPALAAPPSITILSPANSTLNQSSAEILLNVTTDTSANVTYSIDNGANSTLYNAGTSGFATVNVSEGSHTITVFAINSSNATQSNSSSRGFSLNIIPSLSVADNSAFSSFVVGNTTATYTIQANVTPSGGAAQGVTVSFVLPFGFSNASACEQGFSTSGVSSATCTRSYGSVGAGSVLQANLTVSLNISALTSYDAREVQFASNCTDGNGCSQATTARNYTGARLAVNPRPDATVPGSSSLLFTKWVQSEGEYDLMMPIYAFDQAAGRPVLANNTFGEIVYFGGKSFFEMPDFMKLYSYNLTFAISAASAGVFTVRSALSTGGNSQGMLPLNVQTNSFTDFMSNATRSFTTAFPNPSQFTVWRNGVNYSSTDLAALGAGFSWNTAGDQSSAMLTINVTNTTFASAEWTVMVNHMNSTGGRSSPLFVNSQQLSGWSFEEPPKFGQSVNQTYTLNVSNNLQNYTLSNMRVAVMQPMNVTMIDASANTTRQFNMTLNPQLLLWNGTAYASSSAIFTKDSTVNFLDNYPGSPGYGNNITIYLKSFYLNLSAISGWAPGSSAQARFTASMTFPVMDEAANTPGTAGSSNSYNATINAPQAAPLNLTDKVPGLGSGAENVVVKIDGVTIDPSNYTIGSLVLDSVDSGTHTVSVSYSVPAASSSGGGSGGGGAGGGGGGGAPFASNTQNYYIDQITSGAAHIVRSASNGSSLKQVTIEISNTARTITLTITHYTARPSAISDAPGRVFQYIEINHSAVLNESNIDSIRLKFNVSKSWLQSNNIVSSGLSVYRLGATWQKLKTTVIGESAEEVEVEAESPGLSYFAISGEPSAPGPLSAPPSAPSAPSAPTGPVCGNGACDSGESYLNCPTDCTRPAAVCGNGRCEFGESTASCPADCQAIIPTSAGDNTAVVAVAVVIILAAGGWWYYRGTKSRRRLR
jgi:PGF-pre-PGF domain-containing protein